MSFATLSPPDVSAFPSLEAAFLLALAAFLASLSAFIANFSSSENSFFLISFFSDNERSAIFSAKDSSLSTFTSSSIFASFSKFVPEESFSSSFSAAFFSSFFRFFSSFLITCFTFCGTGISSTSRFIQDSGTSSSSQDSFNSNSSSLGSCCSVSSSVSDFLEVLFCFPLSFFLT